MNPSEKRTDKSKRSLLARRVLAAIAMVCFSAWELYRSKHVTALEVLIIIVVVLAVFSKPSSRVFWFLLGIAVGIFLALVVPPIHF